MSHTTTYVGSLGLAGAVPGAAAAVTAGISGINGALPDIQARLTALASFSPSIGTIADDIVLATSVLASLQVALAAGAVPPSISVQIAIVSALVASLAATVAAVNANLDIVTNISSLLGAAGVHAYAYDGPANEIGAGLTFVTGLPGESPATIHCNALLLATTSGATWSSMAGLFKVTP